MSATNEPSKGKPIARNTGSLCGHVVIRYVNETKYECVPCGTPVEKDGTYLDIDYDRCLKSQ